MQPPGTSGIHLGSFDLGTGMMGPTVQLPVTVAGGGIVGNIIVGIDEDEVHGIYFVRIDPSTGLNLTAPIGLGKQ